MEQRLQLLEEEMKLLKNQIRSVLLDIEGCQPLLLRF